MSKELKEMCERVLEFLEELGYYFDFEGDEFYLEIESDRNGTIVIEADESFDTIDITSDGEYDYFYNVNDALFKLIFLLTDINPIEVIRKC